MSLRNKLHSSMKEACFRFVTACACNTYDTIRQSRCVKLAIITAQRRIQLISYCDLSIQCQIVNTLNQSFKRSGQRKFFIFWPCVVQQPPRKVKTEGMSLLVFKRRLRRDLLFRSFNKDLVCLRIHFLVFNVI